MSDEKATDGPPPYRSPAQRMAALELAQKVRCGNARTLNAIKAAPAGDALDAVVTILREAQPGAPVESMPIFRLLCAPRLLGPSKVAVLLRAADIVSGDRRLRSLTVRQRGILADALAIKREAIR